MDTKELVEDFERSDPAKNKANGIVAAAMVVVTILMLLAAVVSQHISFFWLAAAAATVAVYLILYIHECSAIDFPFMPKPGLGLLLAGFALTYLKVGPQLLHIAFLVFGTGLIAAAAANYSARQEQKKQLKKAKEAAALMDEARVHASKEFDKKEALEAIERKKRNSKYAPDGSLEIQEDRRKSSAHMPPDKKERMEAAEKALKDPELGLPGQVNSKENQQPDWVRRNSKAGASIADAGPRQSMQRGSTTGFEDRRGSTLGSRSSISQSGSKQLPPRKSKDLSAGTSPQRSKEMIGSGSKEMVGGRSTKDVPRQSKKRASLGLEP
jgi:hypothetical protein